MTGSNRAITDSTLRVLIAPIARPTFDVPLAQQVADTVFRQLTRAGIQVLGDAALIMDAEGARTTENLLRIEACDLLLILQASFADSSMALQLAALAHARKAGIMLWAVPDVRDGGRLRLNSLCGINLAGHALTLRRIPYDYLLEAPDAPAAIARMQVLARAGRARRLLDGMRVGVVGEHPAGFDTCRYDASDLQARFGVEVEPMALAPVLADAAVADEEARKPFLARAASLAPNLHEMDAAAVRGTAGVHAALSSRVQAQALNGVAVRCWPEFFTELGCAACGAMSVLNDAHCPASCEADVNGTVTSLLLQTIANAPAFIADLVSIDKEDNTGVLWHCGLAPASMADTEDGDGIRATLHSNRKLPLLFEFALKPGRVTLARIHRAALEGGGEGYRLVIGSGEMIKAPRPFGGTSGVIRFDKPAAAVLDTIMRNGLEHHVCLVYGDHAAELRAFATLAGLPVIELT